MMLKIINLSLSFKTEKGELRLFQDISLQIDRNEIVGIVGESGSGKTTLAYAISGLLPPNARIESGQILFNDVDLLTLKESERREIRGKKITMVFQDPSTSLNPLFRIKDQMLDVIKKNTGITGRAAEKYAVELLRNVELPDAEIVMKSFPFELSGGMQQRVMIALALSSNPELVIADEPTTAVDATIQVQILDLLKRLRKERGFSMILITHSAMVAKEVCDRIAVMYAGEIVEIGPANSVLEEPKHPYTKALIASIPTPRKPGEPKKLLSVVPGQIPDLTQPPTGCRFHPRCPYRFEICSLKRPDMYKVDDCEVRCFLFERNPQS